VRLAHLALVCCCACTAARREASGTVVRAVRFDGNGGLLSNHNDYQLRQALTQRASPPGVLTWPLSQLVHPAVLDERALAEDAWRLEVWYAHHGWFDARLTGWTLTEVRPARGRRAAVVDVRGRVDPGAPSLVNAVALLGPGGEPLLPDQGKGLALSALHMTGFGPGMVFDRETLDWTLASMAARYRDNGYPYAQVTAAVEARPQELAVDVAFAVEAGRSARLGAVTFTGAERVPERFLRDAIHLEPGAPYSQAALAVAQRELFSLGTFSVVSVEPDLRDPTQAEVPVRIAVTETAARSVRLGLGGVFDGVELTPRMTARLRHANLLHRLIRFELGGTLGITYPYDVGVGVGDPVPTYDLAASLGLPRALGPSWTVEARGRLRQDEQAGLWIYQNPEADLQLVWDAGGDWVVRAGPHVELYRYLLDAPETLQFARVLYGTGFTNPYTLSALDQQVVVDQRDDPLSPTRGRFGSLLLREAFPLREDGYAFVSGTLDLRAYAPVGRIRSGFPLTAATRLGVQVLQPLQGRALPYPELAFLGGVTSLRGFRTAQVGPYDTLCTEVDGEIFPYHLAHGGQAAVDASAELRYDWRYGVSFAGFADGGWLAENLRRVDQQVVRWDVGVGARYRSAVGPIRLDVAFRPLVPEDLGPTQVIGCEGPVEPRTFDVISLFGGGGGQARPPWAAVVFLAIGEAF
jgi:translocation and assembly module TamA